MRESTRIVLRLTLGQQMALADLIAEHSRCPQHTEVYDNGIVKTSVADLLTIVSNYREVEITSSAEQARMAETYLSRPYNKGERSSTMDPNANEVRDERVFAAFRTIIETLEPDWTQNSSGDGTVCNIRLELKHDTSSNKYRLVANSDKHGARTLKTIVPANSEQERFSEALYNQRDMSSSSPKSKV